MKQISILGSTGSIGTTALTLAGMFPKRFRVSALAARSNVMLLSEQIKRFSPAVAVVYDEDGAARLKERLPSSRTDILFGPEGYRTAAALDQTDIVLNAMVGAAGLTPTLAAIEAGKDIVLANKETLVMAGELVMKSAHEKGVSILPVDSEHSAVFQCIAGSRRDDLDRIILTGSGGPFLRTPADAFASITPEDALRHPNWRMGKKITIDSATLMNKGLEVIEAKWLFDVPLEAIEVVIHPQSIVHSMVSFRDGAVIAQLGIPDMKTAIAYALSQPERLPLNQPLPDSIRCGILTFESPDTVRFPCLPLALEACRRGHTYPAVLNASNEMAVEAFLSRGLAYSEISEVVKKTMESHTPVFHPSVSDILDADQWARKSAEVLIQATGW